MSAGVLDVTLAGWAATTGLIVVLFAIDVFVSRRGHAHSVGFREAAIASAFYVSVALAFGVVFGLIAGASADHASSAASSAG